VPRYNFYMRQAFEKRRGVLRALLAKVARVRVARDFYRFDVERRVFDWLKRLRTGLDRQQPKVAEE